mgnify:CR=1 FL=1|jgi:hypothetical protein
MIMGKDFKFRDDLKEDTVPIEILLDPYKGIVYRYIKVGVKENDNETATLKFQYHLYEMGEHTETKLRKDQQFERTLGLILNTLILDAAEADQNEHREDDTQEPNKE